MKTKSKTSNGRKPWTDDQLRVIFSNLPTRENAAKLARIYGRTTGAVLLIYKFGMASKTMIPKGNAYLEQIHRIAREMGWTTGPTRGSVNWLHYEARLASEAAMQLVSEPAGEAGDQS
jgi:hypothetical protein